MTGAMHRQADTPHTPFPVPMSAAASLSTARFRLMRSANQTVNAIVARMMARPAGEARERTSTVTRAPIRAMATLRRYLPEYDAPGIRRREVISRPSNNAKTMGPILARVENTGSLTNSSAGSTRGPFSNSVPLVTT